MKKFLSIVLVLCFMLSISALAAETTYYGAYTILDFGSDSRSADEWGQKVLAAWSMTSCIREENADTWTLTVTEVPASMGVSSTPNMTMKTAKAITYGDIELGNGWGTYKAIGYDSNTGNWIYGDEWVGKNQYMKIRLKNMSDNDHISIFITDNPGTLAYTRVMGFEVSTNDEEFQNYVVDCIKANAVYGCKSNYSLAASRDSQWANGYVNTFIFYAFGAWAYSQYASAGCDTTSKIVVGAQVEIDYMIFAPTADMAAGYKSFAEGYDPELDETTTAAPEESTTAAPEESTTAAPEESTTAAPEESTTADSNETTVDSNETTAEPGETTVDSDETTAAPEETTAAPEETTAASDETTAAPAETTAAPAETTTAAPAGTTASSSTADNGEEGGNNTVLIIVIVAVVVIGAGVACFFIFKKK